MSMRRVVIKYALIATPFLLVAFAFYLWVLYGQLQQAFSNEAQYTPTRIYSDVARIASPQNRARVEERLRALSYKFDPAGPSIAFRLHPIDYPLYLLPPTHPQLEQGPHEVTLAFDGAGPAAPLSSVKIDGSSSNDVYLEPELAATLSRSAGSGHEIRTIIHFFDDNSNDIDAYAMTWKAIIAIEDQHFMEHSGLDPRGLARAFLVDLRTLSFAQGGSTITQQLVKNLMARHSRNIFKKFNELFLALLLEATHKKEEILDRYLNEVYLGQVGSLEVHGVAEGAKHFFGKKLENLNLGEIAMMAGLIRGPGYYSPYRYWDRAVERQRLVLRKMVETGQIAQGEADEAAKMPIHLAPPQNSSNKAPYFTDFVKAELIRELAGKITEQEVPDAGFRVYTTLDMRENAAAQLAVSRGIADLEARLKLAPTDRLEGALASVDQSTGYIRALVGGRNYGQSNFNRILNMKRQVGSTFKPIVYLTAIEKGDDEEGVPYGPGHPADDAPWTLIFDHGKQRWAPRNYEKEFRGWTSFRVALAHSINTVAARLGHEIGIDNVIKTARALGIESDLPAVPSLSLGVAELSPIELLRVYSTLANHGTQPELTVIRGITQNDGTGYAWFLSHPKPVYDPAATDLLTDMLQTVFADGTASAAKLMGFERPAAGKTGTTSHHRDAWFAGYTPQLTTVVWVGMDQTPVVKENAANPEAESEDDLHTKVILTGAGSALPIWVDYMKHVLIGEPDLPFTPGNELVNVEIDPHTGKRASPGCPPSQTVTEKYMRGHEPSASSCEPGWPTSSPETIDSL